MTFNTNLFAELADDGSTATHEAPGLVNVVDVYLNEGAAYDSGTLTLYTSPDGGTTWVAVPSGAWTTGDGLLASLTVYGNDIRFTASSVAGAAAELTAQVVCTAKSEAYRTEGTVTANGNTTIVLPRGTAGFLYADGTWDSASLKLQGTVDGGTTWYDLTAAITADGGVALANTSGITQLRLNVTSVATAADLTWWLVAG